MAHVPGSATKQSNKTNKYFWTLFFKSGFAGGRFIARGQIGLPMSMVELCAGNDQQTKKS